MNNLAIRGSLWAAAEQAGTLQRPYPTAPPAAFGRHRNASISAPAAISASATLRTSLLPPQCSGISECHDPTIEALGNRGKVPQSLRRRPLPYINFSVFTLIESP